MLGEGVLKAFHLELWCTVMRMATLLAAAILGEAADFLIRHTTLFGKTLGAVSWSRN